MWLVILEFAGIFVGSAYSFSNSLDASRFFVGVGTGFWLIFMSYQLAIYSEKMAFSNGALELANWKITLGDVHVSISFLIAGVAMIITTIWRTGNSNENAS